MKNTKLAYLGDTIYDYEGMERKLEREALKGWKLLKKQGKTMMKFERITPTPLKYTVTYFHEASEFNSEPTENQKVFIEMCEASGWQYICSAGQMLIFCSEKENPTPIETDEQQKLNSIHKSMKAGFLPSYYLLVAISLMFIGMRIYDMFNRPIYFYSEATNIISLVLFAILMCWEIYYIARYFVWKNKSQKSIDVGGGCVPAGGKAIQKVFYAFIAVVILIYACSTFLRSSQTIFLSIAMFVVMFGIIFAILRLVKKSRLQKIASIAVYSITSFVLIMALTFGGLMLYLQSDWNTPNKEIYQDTLPLTLENFTQIPNVEYSYKASIDETFLLEYGAYRQYPPTGDYESPKIDYEIYTSNLDFVRKIVLSDLLSSYDYDAENVEFEYRNIWTEIEIQGADFAYQVYRNNQPIFDKYIICKGGSIISIFFVDDFSASEIENAINILLVQM
ncbi:MAG: DUF2812 domain-containing protein [Bacillota bacterium]